MADCRPIFIIGSPRSGTTLLRLMIDSHPDLSCGPETHFLGAFEDVIRRHGQRIERFGYTDADWHRQTAEFFDGFHGDYARRRGKRRWAEKTPRYTLRLPFINSVFPDSQFIHIIRDGRDVVASHLDRWGYRSALRSARRMWRLHVDTAREFGRGVDPVRYHEVRYESLVTTPEIAMRGVLEFLGESWDPRVLTYDQASHDGRHYGLAEQRREQAGDSSLIYTSRIGSGRKIDPLLRTVLRATSRRLLMDLGYV